jgi:hypothetical protein
VDSGLRAEMSCRASAHKEYIDSSSPYEPKPTRELDLMIDNLFTLDIGYRRIKAREMGDAEYENIHRVIPCTLQSVFPDNLKFPLTSWSSRNYHHFAQQTSEGVHVFIQILTNLKY